ncbi:unnamed protein product [Albugo candida]|uniref:tRNA/rRNA methyltransferase SpoU type domain-containing protein n=1 Tax=Albugo candida TaxID=65357 RepID=A0A024G9G8_9STRA|nr:unnamed protein product [Albugo candida]|eukprot:CCI42952.1 unnamed protein product [Albugo candida]
MNAFTALLCDVSSAVFDEQLYLKKDVTLSVPDRLAIVMSRETDGVSDTMLQAETHRAYVPIYGFTDSRNLNVAAG